jgi:hypothetical protein
VVGDGALLDVSAVGGGFTLGASQTLSGSGTVNGTVSNSGMIAAGGAGGIIGMLTFNNSPVCNGSIRLKVSRNNGALTNDQVNLPSVGITYGGTLTVSNVSEPLQAGDSFQLFSAASYDGAFAVTNLPPLNAGLAWSNSLASDGKISVISTVSTVSTNITWSADGTSLTLSWPGDHIGWRLQVQTNSLSDTNWVDVPGSTLTNDMILPIDPAKGRVFYRLIYP